jgi:hypothetical protein|tara:strand:+ start:1200 stop:2078 length:879 start_codon:yes stop_codon:yes gene_type:complete
MGISSLVGRILPAATAFVTSGGNPVAAAASFAAADQARNQAKKVRIQNEIATNQYKERLNMAFGDPNVPGAFPTPRPSSISSPGFFDRVGGIASNIGDTLLTGLESAVPSFINRQIFGGQRPQSASQGPALTTITNVGAQESQGSGTIQAGAGALLPAILGGARSLLKSPAGQLALGAGAGGALSFMSPDGKKMRITRKMKSQARTVLNIAGGNISTAADILNISDEMMVTILLKRFRNDGPVVTKAALRKTKSTIRRLHSMQDVLKSITPTAAGRRRAPMKRAMSTTLIKN